MNLSTFFNNVGLVGLATAVLQGLTLVIFIVAARMMSPDDLGFYAIISIIIAYSSQLSEFGGGAYIIHLKTINSDIVNSVLTFNIILALIQMVGIILAAPLIAAYFNFNVALPLQLASITILLASCANIYRSLFQKNLSFDLLAKVEIVATLVSFITAYIAIQADLGIIGLVLFPLLKNLIELISLIYLRKRKFSLNINKSEFTKIYRYSIYLILNNLVSQFSRSVDQLLVGKFLGSALLGVYSVAHKIMLFPVHRVSAVILRVMFPTLAMERDNMDDFRQGYLKVLSIVVAVSTFISCWIWLHADELVEILLGAQWQYVSQLLYVLAPIAIVQSAMSTVGPIFLITGKTKLGLQLQLITTACITFSVILGLRYNITGVVWLYAIANYALFLPLFKKSTALIDLNILTSLNVIGKSFIIGGFVPLSFFILLNSFGYKSLEVFYANTVFCTVAAFTIIFVVFKVYR